MVQKMVDTTHVHTYETDFPHDNRKTIFNHDIQTQCVYNLAGINLLHKMEDGSIKIKHERVQVGIGAMFNFRIHVDRIQRTMLIENTNKKVGIETTYDADVTDLPKSIYDFKTVYKLQ